MRGECNLKDAFPGTGQIQITVVDTNEVGSSALLSWTDALRMVRMLPAHSPGGQINYGDLAKVIEEIPRGLARTQGATVMMAALAFVWFHPDMDCRRLMRRALKMVMREYGAVRLVGVSNPPEIAWVIYPPGGRPAGETLQ